MVWSQVTICSADYAKDQRLRRALAGIVHDADFSLGGTDSYESNVSMRFVRVGSYLFGFGLKTYPRLTSRNLLCLRLVAYGFRTGFEFVSKPIPNEENVWEFASHTACGVGFETGYWF